MLWSDFLLSVSSVSCFGSLPFASDFLQWGSQAAKWELKLPNISWWVCSCCSCCDTARLGSSLPLRSFSQADPLLPAWDLCCAWWQIFSSSPCNFEWSYTLLHTLYKVKTMCQTWMILTTGYHQTQSPVPEQHRWQLPPKISTHILQELQLFHSYLAMLLGYPSLIPSNYILATCSCMISRVMRCELGHRQTDTSRIQFQHLAALFVKGLWRCQHWIFCAAALSRLLRCPNTSAGPWALGTGQERLSKDDSWNLSLGTPYFKKSRRWDCLDCLCNQRLADPWDSVEYCFVASAFQAV